MEEAFKWTSKDKGYLYAKQLLNELYETHYGLHDHRHDPHPFGLVLQKDCERYIDHYLFEAYLETFIYKDIHKVTGLSFDDFLNRPRYEIEKIVRVVDGFKKKEATVTQGVMNDLQSSNKT